MKELNLEPVSKRVVLPVPSSTAAGVGVDSNDNWRAKNNAKPVVLTRSKHVGSYAEGVATD